MKTTRKFIFDLVYYFSEYNEFNARTYTMRSNIVKACRAYGITSRETNEVLVELIEAGAIEKMEINVENIDYPVAAYKQLVNEIE